MGGASSSTTSTRCQLWIPVGFAHGFCVLSEVADFVYKCTSYYDGATESGFPFDDPDVGIEWPDVELIFSERDRDGAAAGRDRRLAAVLRVNGRFAPSPTGTLHLGNLRTALLAWLFARSAGSARSSCGWRTSTRAASRPGVAEEQLADLAAIGLDWDGDGRASSRRARARYDAALERLRRRRALYECFCTRAEIRDAASAPHGPLPEGAYPGTLPAS